MEHTERSESTTQCPLPLAHTRDALVGHEKSHFSVSGAMGPQPGGSRWRKEVGRGRTGFRQNLSRLFPSMEVNGAEKWLSS